MECRPRASFSSKTDSKSAHLQGFRVSDRTRTGDHLDHNQELYQLSYAHRAPLNLPASALNAPGRTRTCDLLLRRQLLYPAELRGLGRSVAPPNAVRNSLAAEGLSVAW